MSPPWAGCTFSVPLHHFGVATHSSCSLQEEAQAQAMFKETRAHVANSSCCLCLAVLLLLTHFSLDRSSTPQRRSEDWSPKQKRVCCLLVMRRPANGALTIDQTVPKHDSNKPRNLREGSQSNPPGRAPWCRWFFLSLQRLDMHAIEDKCQAASSPMIERAMNR